MRSGFSLVQISILLTVASLVMVTVLPRQNTPLEASKQSTDKMDAVYQSLRQFHVANGRLPCPADATKATGHADYGKEAANNNITNNCTGGTPAANFADSTNKVAIGMVPVKALGLSSDYALDSYGRNVTYAVDTNATVCGWTSSTLPGTITVTDNGIANPTVAALVSHGPDGHGAYIPLPGASGTATRLNTNTADADKRTNAHVDASFVATSALNQFVKKSATSTFNDTLIYKNTAWNLSNFPSSAPRITAITPPANGTYSSGNTLTFTVTFNTAVTVTGTPRLALSPISGSLVGGTAYANYVSGTGTTTLTFTYSVQSADNAPTGLTIAAAVQANGGTIKAGNACPLASFTAPNLSGVILGGTSLGYYIADTLNYRIRKVSESKIITTFAGTGSAGNTGNGGLATSATFTDIRNIATDLNGNLFIVDYGAHVVRRIDKATNIITTVVGDGVAGSWMKNLNCDGGPCGTETRLNRPWGIAVDNNNNMIISDRDNNRVLRLNVITNKIMVLAGTGTQGYSGNGGDPASAQLYWPMGVAVDSSNNVYIGDAGNCLVRKLTYDVMNITPTSYIISDYAGGGLGGGAGNCGVTGDRGTATTAQIGSATDLELDASGNLYITDWDRWVIRKVRSDGIITTFAGVMANGTSGDGNYANYDGIAGTFPANPDISGMPPVTGGPAAYIRAGLGLSVDVDGNVYFADQKACSIRKVDTGGIITLIGGTSNMCGFANDGASVTTWGATLNRPYDVLIIPQGGVYPGPPCGAC